MLLISAVSLSLVRIACERDPTLSFCDSHILGDPVTSTTKPVLPTTKPSTPLSDDKKVPGYIQKEQEQFLTWLTDFKDEVPDSEIDTEELEASRRKHNSIEAYCQKYRVS
ncbi:unnamed protein product [Strongylus vulgaris]|uniref:Calponin-homology (CH) domain-containing protein n=1 Tax=Strongylus vulgaris TaxID=40348 RepID=A0A3P7IY72_STRVU|nr:unnamed protein product [Strongylus vulgaris]